MNSFDESFNGLPITDGFFGFLSDVFDLGFNGIVVGDGSFNGDFDGAGDIFVFDDFSFEGHFDDCFDLIDDGVFLFEWDVFDSGFNWDFFGNSSLDEVLNVALANGVSSAQGLILGFVA